MNKRIEIALKNVFINKLVVKTFGGISMKDNSRTGPLLYVWTNSLPKIKVL